MRRLSKSHVWVRFLLARLLLGAMTFALLTLLTVDPAAAEGGGSSNSTVIGRGDIITTITSMTPRNGPGNRPGGGSRPKPKCRTFTLNDAQIEFLIAYITLNPDTLVSKEFESILREYLIGEYQLDNPEYDNPEYDIRVRSCEGSPAEFSAVPRLAPTDVQSSLGRRMITRLPETQAVQSPPEGVSVPVNQPIFMSIPASAWIPVEATLEAAGIVADVRAEPVSIRIYNGDSSNELKHCPGRGVLFDPLNLLSPMKQANDPLACTITYRAPDSYIGAVSVIWSAEWRTGGGPWRSLGMIPRTRVFERTIREVRTAIASAATRHSN
ncbi:MAG TPA: hypothetical protein VL068_08330 [Microthrixaceae bacterium]|nr:hypothetical protein [Microthrixaceae bacterium]